MKKLELFIDNQVLLSKRTQNLGITNHYAILSKQLLELGLKINISCPIFVEFGKNLKARNSLMCFFASIIRKIDERVFWKIGRLESLHRAKKADYIFTTFFYSHWFDIYAENDALTKMIVCNHDCINENLDSSDYAISTAYQSKKEFLLASKAVYVPSRWTYERTIFHYPSVKNKLFLIPHFLDFCENDIKEIIASRFRKSEVGERIESLRLLHVGSTESYKNFELIYKMVASSKIKVELIMIGTGASAHLEERIRSLRSMGHKVQIIPYASKDEKKEQFLLADVLLMPSVDEGFSFPTYEAAISGLPIVKFSKNPWGFRGLTITHSFSVNMIVKSLKKHYRGDSHRITQSIIEELKLNNDLSKNGLRQLCEFLLEAK